MASGFGDVVVLLPGIGGSVLARDGKEIWAPTPGAALRGILSLGRTIKRLQLAGDDPSVDDLGDGVRVTRVVPDLHVLPGLDWKIDGYGRFAKHLIDRMRLERGRNYFEFPYDWRRDNRVAARQLARKATEWLDAWRQTGNPDAKLVLVGHSMGGIVARIFLEELEGWDRTRRLVTFGTPYSGSVNALQFLSNGFKKGWGPFTVDLTDTIRSFTSVYQLLPSYRCLRTGDPGEQWQPLDGPARVPGLDRDKLTDALAMHRGLRDAVAEHARTDYDGTGGYEIRPIVGSFQRTWLAARLDDAGRVVVSTARGAGEEGGDGTVPRISAMPHEYLDGWRNAAFMSERHASLQNDDAVIDHLAGVLQGAPQRPVDLFPAGDVPVSLTVTDAILPEPVLIEAAVRDPGFAVAATATPVTGGAPRTVALTADAGDPGTFRAELHDWPAGDYRLAVGGTGVSTVTDVFSVVDPAELTGAAAGG